MVILYVIICVFILNIVLQVIYCRYKSNRWKQVNRPSIDYSNVTSVPTGNTINSERQFKETIENWITSLLRINLFFVSYIPSHHIRMIFYKWVYCMNVESHVVIYYGAEIRDPWKVYIGEGSIIGDRAILDGRCGIIIGKNVNLSTGAWLYTLQHDLNDSQFGTNDKGKMIIVNDRAWISTRTVILPGVTVGEGAVVAAGAVVSKNVPSFSVVGGVPAKVIGSRNKQINYEFKGNHLHFL